MASIDYARARRLLARRDPVIAGLMRRHGDCGLEAAQRSDHFRALIHAIIAQQLSTKAAATIEARFAAIFKDGPAAFDSAQAGEAGHDVRGVTPAAIACVSDEQLRSVGLSPQKLRYVRDLCVHLLDGSLDLDSLEHLTDEDVVAALTRVKGIGRWTAEMFLMFRLHRPDVLPVGDLGIVKAVKQAYKLRARPTPARLTKIGEPWRPYRSVACWYLWASLDPAPLED
jgi:DNA-3-methyladenine glycosylase II